MHFTSVNSPFASHLDKLDGLPLLSNYVACLHPPLPESWVALPSLLPLQSHLKEQVVKEGSVNKYKDEFVKLKCKKKGEEIVSYRVTVT